MDLEGLRRAIRLEAASFKLNCFSVCSRQSFLFQMALKFFRQAAKEGVPAAYTMMGKVIYYCTHNILLVQLSLRPVVLRFMLKDMMIYQGTMTLPESTFRKLSTL